MKLYSYNNGSASAKALAAGLGIKMIKHEGEELDILKHVVINWGCSQFSRVFYNKQTLNIPLAIAKAVNKLTAFQTMKDVVNIPEFTDDRYEAINWLAGGHTVVARTKLNGHSGEGIVIVEPKFEAGQEIPDAPLYVKYIKKNAEYRIHVFQEEVFFVQKKARKLDVPDEEVNWQVRNHQNGFIYANQDVQVQEEAKKQAIMAVKTLGLDFGAVDIIETAKGRVFVLEVNTACGLEGTTLQKYIEQFNKFKD
jgi:glutathione synthase/RimK-type ligase-like ATP-grasp enzyme